MVHLFLKKILKEILVWASEEYNLGIFFSLKC